MLSTVPRTLRSHHLSRIQCFSQLYIQNRSYVSRRQKALQQHKAHMSKEYEKMKESEYGIKIKIDPREAKTFDVCDIVLCSVFIYN